jgi:hypothetical protein
MGHRSPPSAQTARAFSHLAIGAAVSALPASGNKENIDAAINKIAEVSPGAGKVLKANAWTTVAAFLVGFAAVLAGLNDGYDVYEKYEVRDKLSLLYQAMSKIIVKPVSSHEYHVDHPKGDEHPRTSQDRSGNLRTYRDRLNNSTSIPSNIPVPIPRPRRP